MAVLGVVCLCIGHDRELCKMAEPIEMLFVEGDGWHTCVGPRNYVLDGRHLAYTIERFMLGGSAGCNSMFNSPRAEGHLFAGNDQLFNWYFWKEPTLGYSKQDFLKLGSGGLRFY